MLFIRRTESFPKELATHFDILYTSASTHASWSTGALSTSLYYVIYIEQFQNR